MAKRRSLSLFLLLGFSLASVPAQATMVTTATTSYRQQTSQQGIAKTISQSGVEPSKSTTATLTLEDLPAGFTKLPPEIAAQMASRMSSLGQQMGQGNLKPENFFAFVNPQKFQIVLGFTTKLPDQPAQASFDQSIQQLEKPEAQQRMQSLLQEQLKTLGGAKVTEFDTPRRERTGILGSTSALTLVQLPALAQRRVSPQAFCSLAEASSGVPRHTEET